jgi:hypothetical protein
MPPRYLRRLSAERLKPCSERMVEACDSTTADQCCGVIPCKLCLEWEDYDGISYGSAEFETSSWSGSVDGKAFAAYWQRSDDCEFIVTLDGAEVYHASCYEGASCRDPSGESAVSTAYLEGTLRWYKYESRELHLVDDPDTGCRDFFCDDCRCSCECLCVTITEYSGTITIGEICDITEYECDPPVWEGTVGDYDLTIALERGSYGECLLSITADGYEQEPVAAPGCGSMQASVTMPNGDVIAVRCKQCSCRDTACPGCCFDLINAGQDFAPIPFEVSAPSCSSIDGATGTFTDDALEPQGKQCGSCGSFSWTGPYETEIFISSVFYNPDGMGGCDVVVGDGLTIRLALYCDAEMGVSDNLASPLCCGRLRLICGTTYETVASDPNLVIGGLGSYITVIEPESCSCDPLSAVFSLCRLTPKPQTNPSPECPFPPGYEVPSCDLCGVEVVL